jgi:NADH-quinone oxidoreductase subunit A
MSILQPTILNDYLPILILMVVSVGISLILFFLSYLLGKQKPNASKNSPYECGFNAFETARVPFDVKFYLVSLLFIIFDLEVAFLFPWAVTLNKIGMFGFFSAMLFLFVLTIGFIYEWKKGALEWE